MVERTNTQDLVPRRHHERGGCLPIVAAIHGTPESWYSVRDERLVRSATPGSVVSVAAIAILLVLGLSALGWTVVVPIMVLVLALTALAFGCGTMPARDPPSLGAIVNRRTADLRASTAERELVVCLLYRHAADGRLDTAELERRTNAAQMATVRGDLASLLTDLPRLPDMRPSGRRRYQMHEHERW